MLSRNCLCSHTLLLGRFFNIVSNKRSNKKFTICKMFITSILQIVNIALLRRWLWVRAPPNPDLASMAWVYVKKIHDARYSRWMAGYWQALHTLITAKGMKLIRVSSEH